MDKRVIALILGVVAVVVLLAYFFWGWPECHGEGRIKHTCSKCKGKGYLICGHCGIKCPHCKGTGRVKCAQCDGSGYLSPLTPGGEPRTCPTCNGKGYVKCRYYLRGIDRRTGKLWRYYCKGGVIRGVKKCLDCARNKYPGWEICAKCSGRGGNQLGEHWVPCRLCNPRYKPYPNPRPDGKYYVPCRYCKGTRYVKCEHCNGTGKVVCPVCGGKGFKYKRGRSR